MDLEKNKLVVPFPLFAQFEIFVCLIRSWHITQSWIQLIVKAGKFLPIFNFWDGFLSVLLTVAFILWTTFIVSPLGCACAEGLLWRCAPSGGTSDDGGGQLLNEKNQDGDQGMISPSSMTLLKADINNTEYLCRETRKRKYHWKSLFFLKDKINLKR